MLRSEEFADWVSRTVLFFILFIVIITVRIVVISLPSVQKMGFFIKPSELYPTGLLWLQVFNTLLLLPLVPLFIRFGRQLQDILTTALPALRGFGELGHLAGVVGAAIAGYFALYDLFVPPLLLADAVWAYNAVFALVIAGLVIRIAHNLVYVLLGQRQEALAPLLSVGMFALFAVVMRSTVLSMRGVRKLGFALYPGSITYPQGLLWSQIIDTVFRTLLIFMMILFGERIRTMLVTRAQKFHELSRIGYLLIVACAIVFGYLSYDDIILPPLVSQQIAWIYHMIFSLAIAGIGVLTVFWLVRILLKREKRW